MASPGKRAKPSPAKPPGEQAPEDPVAVLRRRWELASVLHFLRVFEPVINGDLELSAEDIETALVSNNGSLSRLHIALLKGIPPVNKQLKIEDGWIIVTAKKLSDWWSWVAEGTNPFTTNLGKEVETYKKQEPIQRLLILKALCEVRSEQDDAVQYVNDEMKKGTDISNFRKGKLGSGSNGTIYWYDGDSTIGHRLYAEGVSVDYKPNWKGSGGRLTKPVINIHWETVATNLNEFLEISEKLCKKGRAESAIAEYLRTEIIPVVEKLQKKKERALKRQQKKDELLAFASYQPRSLRERRRISYTYTDYDQSIKEAIRVTSKAKEHESHEAGTKEKQASNQGGKGANGNSSTNSEHDKDGQEDATYLSDLSSDDDEDRDYNDKDGDSTSSDGDNNAHDPHKSDLEEDAFVPRKRTRLAARMVNDKPRQGLRRSQRNMKNNEDTMDPGQLTPQAMTKKTLRQRPTPVSKQPEAAFSGSDDDRALTVVDSEDDSEDYRAQTVADSEDESE